MSAIKIVFFDIDGTLIDMNKKRISEKMLETLRRLKENGTIICIATGRSPIALPHFEGVEFDAFLTFNGSYCFTEDADIFSNPIPTEDVHMIIQNATALGRPLTVATKNRLASNGKDEDLIEYYSFAKQEIDVADDFEQVANEKVYQLIKKPIVSIDAYGNAAKDSHLVNIGLDDESGGYQMVKYLLECGYEHIKVCAGRDNGVDHLRYVGAQRAMQECAAEGQKLQFVALGMNYEKRKASYDWLVQRRLPGTALFFLSDMYALEAIRFCADKKVAVPQQIGVAGYDDISYAQYSTPRLTTIKQDVQKKAQKAVEILLKWIEEGEEYPQREVELSVTLVKRKSVERD